MLFHLFTQYIHFHAAFQPLHTPQLYLNLLAFGMAWFPFQCRYHQLSVADITATLKYLDKPNASSLSRITYDLFLPLLLLCFISGSGFAHTAGSYGDKQPTRP